MGPSRLRVGVVASLQLLVGARAASDALLELSESLPETFQRVLAYQEEAKSNLRRRSLDEVLERRLRLELTLLYSDSYSYSYDLASEVADEMAVSGSMEVMGMGVAEARAHPTVFEEAIYDVAGLDKSEAPITLTFSDLSDVANDPLDSRRLSLRLAAFQAASAAQRQLEAEGVRVDYELIVASGMVSAVETELLEVMPSKMAASIKEAAENRGVTEAFATVEVTALTAPVVTAAVKPAPTPGPTASSSSRTKQKKKADGATLVIIILACVLVAFTLAAGGLHLMANKRSDP